MTDEFLKEQHDKCYNLLNNNGKYFECSKCGLVIVKSAVMDRCPLCGRIVVTNLEKS